MDEKKIYLTESFLNLKSTFFGNKIERIRFPFAVLNPVEYTKAKTFSFPWDLFCITVVPANKNFFFSTAGSNTSSTLAIWLFIIGVDSPVSIDSFTITVPFINIQSQGIACPSCWISNRSPGTSSVLCIWVIVLFPSLSTLYTFTSQEYLAISWMLSKFSLVS